MEVRSIENANEAEPRLSIPPGQVRARRVRGPQHAVLGAMAREIARRGRKPPGLLDLLGWSIELTDRLAGGRRRALFRPLREAREQREALRYCWPPAEYPRSADIGAFAHEFYVVPLTELASIAEDLSAALANLRGNATDPKEIRALGLLAKLWSALGVKFSLLAGAGGDLKTADAPKVGRQYMAADRAVVDVCPGLAIDPDFWPAYVRFGDSEERRTWLADHIVEGVLGRWRLQGGGRRFGRIAAALDEEVQACGVSHGELKQELAEYAVATLEVVPPPTSSDDPRSSLELRVIRAAERLLTSGALQEPIEAERDEIPDRPGAPGGEKAIEARLLTEELVARAGLPEEDMLLLLLSHEGYSSAEIGERLVLTPENVRVRRLRAKKKLRDAM